MEISGVLAELAPLPGRVVVSGGEPLLQAPALADLLLHAASERRFDVETNGTRPLGPTIDLWDGIITSPKAGPSAGQWVDGAPPPMHPEIAEHATAFKFVVADQTDLDAVLSYVESNQLRADRVWLMPEGTDTDTLTGRTPFVMEAATRHGFNFTSRLHVYGWGDARGH